ARDARRNSPAARDLRPARNRRSRRLAQLRQQFRRRASSGGRLCRPHSQGREAERSAGGAGDEVRARAQSQDCPRARGRGARQAARARRRGDRMSKGSTMSRRDFVTLLGGAALASPFAAYAQNPGIPTVGISILSNPEPYWGYLDEGFRSAGY